MRLNRYREFIKENISSIVEMEDDLDMYLQALKDDGIKVEFLYLQYGGKTGRYSKSQVMDLEKEQGGWFVNSIDSAHIQLELNQIDEDKCKEDLITSNDCIERIRKFLSDKYELSIKYHTLISEWPGTVDFISIDITPKKLVSEKNEYINGVEEDIDIYLQALRDEECVVKFKYKVLHKNTLEPREGSIREVDVQNIRDRKVFGYAIHITLDEFYYMRNSKGGNMCFTTGEVKYSLKYSHKFAILDIIERIETYFKDMKYNVRMTMVERVLSINIEVPKEIRTPIK